MNHERKLNKNNRSGSSSLYLFALMNATRSGPVKFRRKTMKFKLLSYTIVGMSIYMMWTMFFILSELNASLFMSVFHKIAQQIAFGY